MLPLQRTGGRRMRAGKVMLHISFTVRDEDAFIPAATSVVKTSKVKYGGPAR